MAFVHQQPRRSARAQPSGSPSSTSLSQSLLSIQRGDRADRDAQQDWSVVFPGRSKTIAAASKSPSVAEETTSPFVSSLDEREGVESNVELTLPHEQDGTGRFTRPSSPSYAADDEEDEEENVSHPESGVHLSSAVPRIVGPPTTDSSSSHENDSELDALEVTSSILISGSESGRRDSSVSHQRRRFSEWENIQAHPSSSMASSSWAWMSTEISQSHRGKERPRRSTDILPVVFTSDSEGEEEFVARSVALHRTTEDEEAFEEAIANTHSAQSAGLLARAPKRRHRKNGESAKGSKRSNSSAVLASDLQTSRRSAGMRSRHAVGSASNVSARSGSRVRMTEKAKAPSGNNAGIAPSSRGLLNVVLRKIFQIDDDEVLQAFLRDEGPLRVERIAHSSLASDYSAALKTTTQEEIWSRTERNRQLRRTHAVVEERGEVEEEEEGAGDSTDQILTERPTLSLSTSTSFSALAAPHRVRLESNVGEPTLLEALHATVLSSLATVPSGLSIFLAGSRSARLVNYLAGRLVGQIGPSLTERVRKLIDDAEDDTSIQDEIFGRENRSPTTPTRFRGGSHPAISSQSSTTVASRYLESNSSPSLP